MILWLFIKSLRTITQHIKQREKVMKIELKCFATLVDEGACDYRNTTAYEMDDGQTVGHLADLAGVAGEDVKIAFVNGRKGDLSTVLSNGDRVGLVPAVGGM